MWQPARLDRQMATRPDQTDEVEISPQMGRSIQNRPLFGLMLFLTPVVAGLAAIYLNPAAVAVATIAMIPLLLGSIYLEGYPPSPYTMLERGRERDE